jgi:uroporphyrinogen decarboxylase
MNSHERILSTLNRQPPDRVPVDLWFTPEVLASLKKHFLPATGS